MGSPSDAEISLEQKIWLAENELALKKIELSLKIKELEKKPGALRILFTSYAPILTALLAAAVTLWVTNFNSEATANRQAELISLQRTSEDLKTWREAVTRHSIAEHKSTHSAPYKPLIANDETILTLCSLWLDGLTTQESIETANSYIQRKELCAIFVGGYFSLAPKGDADDGLRAQCARSEWIFASARASDQGYRPNDTDTLELAAPEGHFLGEYEVIEESYRKRSGPPLRESTKAEVGGEELLGLPIAYKAKIGCTNSSGLGRTCESKATVRARAFPADCARFIAEN
jgi:hypothetical protein